LQPIGLSAKYLCVSLVDNAGLDPTVSHPCGCHQPAFPTMIISKYAPNTETNIMAVGNELNLESYPAGPAPMMSLRGEGVSM
jgi:hypothetical protein